MGPRLGSLDSVKYLIKYLAKSRKTLKKPTQGPTENYRSENAITQPIAEINTGVLQVQWDKEIAQN